MKKIILDTFPISTNNMYFGKRIMTAEARKRKEAIAWEARAQYHGEPQEGPLSLQIDFYYPNKRNHDLDNIKGLLDAMTSIVWLDDGQITRLELAKYIDTKRPRIEVSLFEL